MALQEGGHLLSPPTSTDRSAVPLFSLRPLTESGQTLTTKLGGSETFIAYGDPLHWAAILALALVLLAIVLGLTMAGVYLGQRRDDHA